MSKLCNIDPIPVGECETRCDYIPNAIKSVKCKKDEYGNYLVMINDNDVWRGADLIIHEDGSLALQFSY